MQYLTTSAELEQAVEDLLGTVGKHEVGGSPAIKRKLPRAHPRFPWLFAERITNIQGLGKPTQQDAETDLEAPAVEQYADYPTYLLTVEFTARPYAVLDDESIFEVGLTWQESEELTTTTDTVAYEWERFVDVEVLPAVEMITAQQGQMLLRRVDAADPDGFGFTGQPTIRMPKAQVIFSWYFVPYSYVTSANSFLTKYLGRVNQFSFYGYPAGSLLYTSFTAQRFTPYFPSTMTGVWSTKTFSTEKLCNIRLVCEYVMREAGSTPPTPADNNWIAAGHNLLPWIGDRKFYYATSYDKDAPLDTTKWYPTYLSFPFELLFQNPDV